MQTHSDHLGLFTIERDEDGCTIETRVCSSSVFWSTVMASGTALMAIGVIAIVSLIAELASSHLVTVAVVLAPVVACWRRLPLRRLPSLYRFSQTLRLDRRGQRLHHTTTWVLGITSTRSWAYGDVIEAPLLVGTYPRVSIRFADGHCVALDAQDFEPAETAALICEYMPGKSSGSAAVEPLRAPGLAENVVRARSETTSRSQPWR